MPRLLGYFSNLIGRTLGIKIARYAPYQERLRKTKALAIHTARLQSDLEAAFGRTADLTIADELRRKTAELEQRNAELVAARAHGQRLTHTINELSTTIARHVSSSVPAGDRHELQERPVIVVAVTEISQLPHLRAMCANANTRARYKFVVFTNMYVDAQRAELQEFCRQNDISMFYDFDLVSGVETYIKYEEAEDAVSSFSSSLDMQAAGNDDRKTTEIIDRLLGEIRLARVYSLRCQRLLQSVGARLVVLFEDNAAIESGIWVTTAKALLVPSVIIPVTISDASEPAEYHFSDGLFWFGDGALDRIIGQRFPHWLYRYKGRWMRRRPFAEPLVALETLGFSQPAPWILNSSKANAIAVESLAMKAHYARLGIPDAQLEPTGSFIDDRLHAAAQNQDELHQRLALDTNKPVLLCAFPPNQVGPHRPELEFKTYRELIDFWLGELLKLDNWQIIVKPHPACRADDVEHMRSFPLMVSPLETCDLIPLCDLYNASVSSTIRWALSSGKPVLNYDVYKFGYSDFTKEAAVITVTARDAFTKQLVQLSTDASLRQRLKQEAERSSGNWGNIDGQSQTRTFAMFDRLMSQAPRPRP